MALRVLLPVCSATIQKIFPMDFLMRKASLEARTSVSGLMKKLVVVDIPQKNSLIDNNRNIAIALPTRSIPVRLPCILERVDLQYQLPMLPNKNLITVDMPILIEKLDPVIKRWEIRTPDVWPVIRKEAARMIQIRRRKMKKHKLRKLRKRMRFLWDRQKFRREQRKENAFKEELYAQIRDAESFDAEKYVAEIIYRINSKPHVETPQERRARIRDLIRKHRSNVTFLRPDYDDIK